MPRRRFTLTADETNVTFECQLTKNKKVSKAWAPCTSPVRRTPASRRPRYVLSVRGTDAAGNTSAS